MPAALRKRATLLVATALLAAQAASPSGQQSPADGASAFDAASVKRNLSGQTRIQFDTPPGRLNAVNVPLRFLIRQAYRVPEARILGGPGWVDTDRFDVAATASSATNGDSIRQMLRRLLTDRFRLAMHSEMRDMPIYVLKVARTDGTLGPGLRRSTTDCAGRGSTTVAGRVQCGILVSQGPQSGSLRGGGTTIDNLARLLGDFLDRPLIDETGLAGAFDLELQFTADRSATPGAAVPGGLTPTANLDDVPRVFTALREQMGLRLDAQRGRADVWVIDAAFAPSVD